MSLEFDGVIPFAELITNYLVWSVFVINSKIPPLMTIKRDDVMLELIVPGTYF